MEIVFDMTTDDQPVTLAPRPRPQQPITLTLPDSVLASIEQIAVERDMTVSALLKLYIGNGLRRDISRQFAERLQNATAQALANRGVSQEAIAEILDEIRTTVRR